MNKSQRIYLNTGNTTNNYIKVQLEQDVDCLEFMSMNIYTKDAYQDFNADYGVLVGRVIANGGVGVPNAKISIFIPLTDEDAQDGTITSIYPYKTPRDKNFEGKRYNLLPRVSQFDKQKNDFSPKQPFGSFPTKPEIVTNQSYLDVYKKYYKYTTITNDSGDYMIFGVPIGVQTVHLSVDITDIGKYSMQPAAMVTNLGYSPYLFYDNNTKIKPSNDLNDLPNIETQEISVDIIPFWGDTENFVIGITRQDFRIRSVLTSTFVVFGTAFTDGQNSQWGSDNSDWGADAPFVGELYFLEDNRDLNISMGSKRIGKITEKIYYYPNTIPDDQIKFADPTTDMLLLDPSQYSIYKRDGDFVFIVNCNRKKIITDEYGAEKDVDSNSESGLFTEFKGFITLEITPEDIPLPPQIHIGAGDTGMARIILKFPQYANNYGGGLDMVHERDGVVYSVQENEAWRKIHYTFKKDKYYSFSKFHPLVKNNLKEHTADNLGGSFNTFISGDYLNAINAVSGGDSWYNTGLIVPAYGTSGYEFPINSVDRFGATWLNLCVYFPQFARLINWSKDVNYLRTSTNFRTQRPSETNLYEQYNLYYMNDNTQEIAAGQINTKWFARSDLNWTDLIEVPIDDIRLMATQPKGFTSQDFYPKNLRGEYHGAMTKPTALPNPWPMTYCPLSSAPNPYPYPDIYFYKGLGTADCIQYLYELGLVGE